MTEPSGVLLLSRSEVKAAMPVLRTQIELVERAYRGVHAGRVELPPKPGIHPRKDAFIHAMPAYLADDDIAAMKWVSGYPENKALGLPYISGLIILNDASTGFPVAILDAIEITAARTAAASGLCIERFAPAGWQSAAILGCGEQGRYHAEVINFLNPDVELRVYDPDVGRARAIPNASVARTPRAAVEDAEIVITAGPILEQPTPTIDVEWVAESCLVLPIDFDAYVRREVVVSAVTFLVDDVGQFAYYRSAGHFSDWPDPDSSVGAELDAPPEAPARSGRVCIANLGIGALDAAFAAQVVKRAEKENRGARFDIWS